MNEEQTVPAAAETPADTKPESAPETAEMPEQSGENQELSGKPAQQQEEEKEPYTLKDFANDALDLMETVICSIFFVMLVFTFVFCIASVEGPSMEPTLYNADRLIVSRLKKTYDDGDILIINCPQATQMTETGDLTHTIGLEKRIVKRLIAQPGQTVDIDFSAGVVYVDGEALSEPYISAPTYIDNGALYYPFTVPEGYYFVLGDNRPVSMDSRHPDVGLVHERDVVGKVILRILPLNAFGTVK